mgnify:FL=1
MAQSGLIGPYSLTEEEIERFVTGAEDWSSAAVYALGPVKDKRFYIRRVGHADGDLVHELSAFLGQYAAFRFKFYRSTRSAYDKECRLYHEFKPRDNVTHPVKPKNTKFNCPVASCEMAE